jgi:hypothetical protein
VLLDIVIRRLGTVVARLQAEADPSNPKELRRLLVDAVRRSGDNESAIGDYEMTVGNAAKGEVITTFVASTS